jgi:hypothetical protein
MEADEQADSDRDAAAIRDALQGQSLGGSSGPTAQSRLDELEELHRRGSVSDEEFEIKRRQIVEDL